MYALKALCRISSILLFIVYLTTVARSAAFGPQHGHKHHHDHNEGRHIHGQPQATQTSQHQSTQTQQIPEHAEVSPHHFDQGSAEHQAHHYQQKQIQADMQLQHTQRAHYRHHEFQRSRVAKSATATQHALTRLYVVGYIVSSTKLVMIPVVEKKKVREIMNAEVKGSTEAILFFEEDTNESMHQELKRSESEEDIILEMESWGVKKEEKMTARYYFTVWLIPLVLMGVALR